MSGEIDAFAPTQRNINISGLIPYKPGQSGNPAGRPKGSRGKFAQQYIEDFYEHWKVNGVKALDECLAKRPDRYLMAAAHLIPQHFKFEHEHKLSVLSDVELRQKVLEAQEELARAGIVVDVTLDATPALPAPSQSE